MSETVRSITLKPGLKVSSVRACPDKFIPGQTDVITGDALM